MFATYTAYQKQFKPNKGQYTLATKSFWQGQLCRKSTVSKGRLIFGWQKLPIFDKVNRVEHVQLWQHVDSHKLLNSTLSLVRTDGRQSRNDVTRNKYCCSTLVRMSQRQSTFDKTATKVRESQKSTTLSTLDFVHCADFRLCEPCRIWLCLQCVLALSDTDANDRHSRCGFRDLEWCGVPRWMHRNESLKGGYVTDSKLCKTFWTNIENFPSPNCSLF